MTLERPLLLLALVALPILWLLSRIAWQRRAVPVSSLLVWSRLGLEPDAPRETRRRYAPKRTPLTKHSMPTASG